MTETIVEPDSKVKLAREAFPLEGGRIYLDTGSVGPVSRWFAETLDQRTKEDVGKGRAMIARFEAIAAAKDQIRAEIASLLGVEPATLELTQSTTAGIHALLTRFPWQPGDEILSTDLEFPRCLDVVRLVARRRGVSLRIAASPENPTEQIDWLVECFSARTRLVVCSGVAYATGAGLPLARIAESAIARGIYTLVDAAQLAGAATLDLGRVPIDFVAMPLQKWLCGPEGLGALYVRSDSAKLHEPDQAIHGLPVLEATANHLAWMRGALGWSWIHERTRELASYARQQLCHMADIELVTPNAHAGLMSVRYQPEHSARIIERLRRQSIVARHRPELDLLRISTAFFNVKDDIDQFVAALS